MQGHFWHQFLTQLFMLFHMVASIFFSMAAPITAYFKDSEWLLKNFDPIRKWLKKLPWRAKPRLPGERSWKVGSGTGSESEIAFCLGSLFKKTNSGLLHRLQGSRGDAQLLKEPFELGGDLAVLKIALIFTNLITLNPSNVILSRSPNPLACWIETTVLIKATGHTNRNYDVIIPKNLKQIEIC